MTILEDSMSETQILTDIKQTMNKYISKCYENYQSYTNPSNHYSSYTHNSTFINVPIYPQHFTHSTPCSPTMKLPSSSSKEGGTITLFFLIVSLISLTIISIVQIFRDDYVNFLLSKLNKKFKKVNNPLIKQTFKLWKTKFANRTRNKLFVKICIIIASFIAIMSFSTEFFITSIIILGVCLMCYTILYCLDYYDDKETKYYYDLVFLIDQQISKRDQ